MIFLLKDDVPITYLCRHFSVSRSGYYDWLARSKLLDSRPIENIINSIKGIFEKSKGTYGSPRVYQEIKSQGNSICENTIAKYMRKLGLDARFKKKHRVQTTNSNHKGPIADRIFKIEEMLPSAPREILAGDITYIDLNGRFFYLSVVMDIFNREILGWSLQDTLESSGVVRAMENALNNCEGNTTKIIFHSDRGVQYSSEIYRALLNKEEIIPSMSRKGNCYDNAYVESWFKSFKSEWIYRRSYSSPEELRASIFEYIETWYNTRRRHSSIEYLPLREYIKRHAVACL